MFVRASKMEKRKGWSTTNSVGNVGSAHPKTIVRAMNKEKSMYRNKSRRRGVLKYKRQFILWNYH